MIRKPPGGAGALLLTFAGGTSSPSSEIGDQAQNHGPGPEVHEPQAPNLGWAWYMVKYGPGLHFCPIAGLLLGLFLS